MEDLLYCRDLFEPIELQGIMPNNVKANEWKRLNRKATATIRQWIDVSVIHDVATETDAYQVWKKLEDLYQRKNAQNKAYLIRRLVNLKYKDGQNASEHLNNFQEILNQLATMKLLLDDEVQALILLSSLPDSWETLVVMLSNSTASDKLTLTMVKDSILNEANRRKEQGLTDTNSEALVTEQRGRSKNRSFHGKRDDGSHDKNNHEKSRGRSKSRKDVTCYYCKRPGHFQRECRKYKRDQDKTNGKKEETQSTTAVAFDDEVMIACDDACINLTCQEPSWVIDSAATYHVTSRRDFFSSYSKGDFGHVRMGNDAVANIIGMGDVCLETNTGCRLLLRNVRHVPDIRLHLISACVLDDESYSSHFG